MIQINTVLYPFYGRLTAVQKSVYQEILPGLQKVYKSIPISTSCTSQDVSAAVDAVFYDRPELIWFKGTGTVMTRNGVAVSFEGKYNVLGDNPEMYSQLLQRAVDDYLNAAKGQQLLQQERIIHDKMVKDVSYVHTPLDQTAYAALVERKAVCAGYTRAFQLLMQKIGIPCYYCFGEAEGESSTKDSWGRHAWNILKLGSDYYAIDITWDDQFNDQKGFTSYKYYNCTDAKMAVNHRRDKKCLFLPECKGTKFSFESVFGSPVIKWVMQDGAIYEGQMKGNKLHGKGKMTWADGAVYQGDFADGKRTGKGVYCFPNGDIYKGDFADGYFHGKGTYYHKNGKITSGIWENGKKKGWI